MSSRKSHRRYRKLFQFQLDLNAEDEKKIASTIHELKVERSYTKTIRDGIRLICDLRNGKTDVLFELFPWVLEQKEKAAPAPPAIDPTDKISGIFKQEMERITQLLTKPIEMGMASKPAQSTLRFSADELEIKQASSSEDDKPTWNFMISSALSVYGDCNFLPADIQAYGVRTGRIKAAAITPKAEKSTGNAKKMQVQLEIKAPDFDEIELPLEL